MSIKSVEFISCIEKLKPVNNFTFWLLHFNYASFPKNAYF